MARRKGMIAIGATIIMLLTAFVPLSVGMPGIGQETDATIWQGNDNGGTPAYDSSGGIFQDIYLYFHKTTSSGGQYILNTAGGSSGLDIMPSAGTVTFYLETPLTKDLLVKGHEIDATTKGFWLDLDVNTLPSGTITIEVLDGTTVVGNTSRTIAGSENWWPVPFLGGVDSVIFKKDSRIGVRLSSTGSTSFQYSQSNKLYVLCDPVSLSGETYNSNGLKTTTFEPNAVEEERHVVVKGKVNDAWGAGDIASVFIDFRDPLGTSIVNASASMNDINYTYDWNYSANQDPGTYKINVTMQDLQNHIFQLELEFTMATYGVHLDSPQAGDAGIISGSVERQGCIDYTVWVLNTGAVATSFTLSQSSSDVSGWTLSINPSSTGTVQPGESKIVTISVCADEAVVEGTRAVFYIQAVASGDPTAKDTIQIITTAVPKINLNFLWTTPSNLCSNLVNTGGSVTCTFEIKNTGFTDLNVSFDMDLDKGAPDWTASVSPSSLTSGTFQLLSSQAVGGSLNISAPDDPSKINESIIVLTVSADDLDPPLEKPLTAHTVMSTGISLEVVGDDTKTVDAKDPAEFFVIVSNTDPNAEHTITMSSSPPGTWTVDFVATDKTFTLNAQGSKTVNIKVNPAPNAAAVSYKIGITGMYQDNPQTWDKVELQVKIKEKHELEISVSSTKKEVGAQESAAFLVTIKNNGNVDENNAQLIVRKQGGDLQAKIQIGTNATETSRVSIRRGQTTTMTVKITPRSEAVHKDKGNWKITIKDLMDQESSVVVNVKLLKDPGDLINEMMSDWQMYVLIALMVVVVVFFVGVRRK